MQLEGEKIARLQDLTVQIAEGVARLLATIEAHEQRIPELIAEQCEIGTPAYPPLRLCPST
jgi:hypothetical protein